LKISVCIERKANLLDHAVAMTLNK
jgi:hypothetical protein